MARTLLLLSLLLVPGRSAMAEPAPFSLSSPSDYQVFQRHGLTTGTITLGGTLPEGIGSEVTLQARLDAGDWRSVALFAVGKTEFSTPYNAPPGGWYRLGVRLLADKQVIGEASVAHVGVGEVFVIAGQSNSANHGAEKQRVGSGNVATFDGEAWRIAHDPQPGASGDGGSFVPPFADAIAERFGVPVGIVATGVGATSVREWLPEGATFPNPPTITDKVTPLPDGTWASKGGLFSNFVERARSLGPAGFRAVLWHQGESDANQRDPSRTLPGELYTRSLKQLIHDSRREVGWDFPWFVAQASYHTPDDPGSPDLRAAQAALWGSGIALEGPDTDALTGEYRDHGGKGVHFSGPGLRAHGQAWADQVAPWLARKLERQTTKVFILAGQSNMQGQGVVAMDGERDYNGGKGNLVWSMEHSASKEKMKHLRDADGNWAVREDVEIWFKSAGEARRGGLTIGYTGYGGSSHIGPELQFGHVVGDYFEEPVLLVKTAWGGKSLYRDFRPPSSGGEVGEYYKQMVAEVQEALHGRPHELAGFIWMQGWNDMISKEATAEYAANLANLAKDIRAEFAVPHLPFVVGELGNGGAADEGGGMHAFREAQRAGAAGIEGAIFIPTAEFARPKELSPNVGHGHHWFGNAESYFLIGDALGRGVTDFISRVVVGL